MNPRIPLLVSSIVLFGAAYSFALSARAEDLLDVYRQAQQNEPQLRAARAQLNQTMEARPLARSRFLPSVSVNAHLTNTNSELSSNSVDTRDDFPSSGYSLILTQPVYHADAFAQYDQADAQVRQAEAQFKAEEVASSLRVAERYFEVLAAQDNMAFVKAEHEAIGKQLEQTKQRFNVGLIAITDVHESQARFDLSSAQVIAADNRLANAWESLREVTGQNYKALAPLASDVPLVSPSPAEIDTWVQGALRQNPYVLAAQYGVVAAENEVSRQRGSGYPTVDAVGAYSNSDTTKSDTSGVERIETLVSVRLSWNLYAGGAVDAYIRRANQQLEQAKEQLEQQRRTIALQTRESYLGVMANISRVNALKQAVISHRSALAATEAGYEVGTRTTVDVLDARTGLFLAQRDYAQTRYDYILATLRLKSSSGSLGAEDLQQANSWLKK